MHRFDISTTDSPLVIARGTSRKGAFQFDSGRSSQFCSGAWAHKGAAANTRE